MKGALSGVHDLAGATSVSVHYAVKWDTGDLWPQCSILGRSLLDSRCVSVTPFLDLELRLDMLAQSLPARQLSVTSSLPTATATSLHNRHAWVSGLVALG